MPVTDLSRLLVDQVEPSGKPVVHYDAGLKGFGLRIMPSGLLPVSWTPR